MAAAAPQAPSPICCQQRDIAEEGDQQAEAGIEDDLFEPPAISERFHCVVCLAVVCICFFDTLFLFYECKTDSCMCPLLFCVHMLFLL